MTQKSSSRSRQVNSAAVVSQEGQPTATDAAREVTDQVKDTASQVADQAQQVTGQVVGQAREQVSSRLAGQKDRAAEGLTNVAQALRQASQQLRDQDQQNVTLYIDRAASQVEKVSNYLKHHELGQLVDDIEGFARRQPALFLGGTFVLGLLGARFLKSSRPYTRPAGGYTSGTTLLQQQRRYAGGYPNTAGVYAARTAPTSGLGTTSGAYATTSRPAHEGSAEQTLEASSYETFDAHFRDHFTTNYADRGYTYDQYTPVYRYGHALATAAQTRGRDWATIEADARARWEERNPGTWEQFKDPVFYAWERARSKG